MITRTDICRATNSATYSRGRQIYEEQKIHSFKAEEMENEYGDKLQQITAVVDEMFTKSGFVWMKRCLRFWRIPVTVRHMISTEGSANTVWPCCFAILTGGKNSGSGWKLREFHQNPRSSSGSLNRRKVRRQARAFPNCFRIMPCAIRRSFCRKQKLAR